LRTKGEDERHPRRWHNKRRRRRRSLLIIVHVRGVIPYKMGPTRCYATQEEEEETYLINPKR
jgi:hypothetical protein